MDRRDLASDTALASRAGPWRRPGGAGGRAGPVRKVAGRAQAPGVEPWPWERRGGGGGGSRGGEETARRGATREWERERRQPPEREHISPEWQTREVGRFMAETCDNGQSAVNGIVQDGRFVCTTSYFVWSSGKFALASWDGSPKCIRDSAVSMHARRIVLAFSKFAIFPNDFRQVTNCLSPN